MSKSTSTSHVQTYHNRPTRRQAPHRRAASTREKNGINPIRELPWIWPAPPRRTDPSQQSAGGGPFAHSSAKQLRRAGVMRSTLPWRPCYVLSLLKARQPPRCTNRKSGPDTCMQSNPSTAASVCDRVNLRYVLRDGSNTAVCTFCTRGLTDGRRLPRAPCARDGHTDQEPPPECRAAPTAPRIARPASATAPMQRPNAPHVPLSC